MWHFINAVVGGFGWFMLVVWSVRGTCRLVDYCTSPFNLDPAPCPHGYADHDECPDCRR